MRLFIGIPVPPEVAGPLHGIIVRNLGRSGISCIPQERYHITLAFLGERDDAALPEIVRAFEQAAGSFPLPPVHCRGITAFPSGAAPRTIVSPAAEGKREISELDRALHRALGIKGRQGKSIPHLTVARVRRGASIDRDRLVGSLGPLVDIRFTPGEIVLYRSFLERSGARYERLRSIRLQA